MRKILELGGVFAAAILVAFGIAAIFMGVNGRNTVRDSLKLEQISGSPDMTPAGITAEAKAAHLNLDNIVIPSMSVAGKAINTGDRARAFAGYMRVHALEATGGLTYAQMGRYLAKSDAPKAKTDGHGGTNDPTVAAVDPKTNQPLDNAARNVWVTETALTTALNTSYMAEQLALFGIVVGVALLLAGIGFAVLDMTALWSGAIKIPGFGRRHALPTA